MKVWFAPTFLVVNEIYPHKIFPTSSVQNTTVFTDFFNDFQKKKKKNGRQSGKHWVSRLFWVLWYLQTVTWTLLQ